MKSILKKILSSMLAGMYWTHVNKTSLVIAKQEIHYGAQERLLTLDDTYTHEEWRDVYHLHTSQRNSKAIAAN